VKEAKARDSFFGYWPVYVRTADVGPKYRLSGIMTLLDKERDQPLAAKIWAEGNVARDNAIAKVKSANQAGNLPVEKIAVVFAGMDRFVNRDLAKHPANNVAELIEAASIGARLGLLDANRIGQQAPIALGYLCEADLLLREEARERFDDKADPDDNPMYFLYTETLHFAFYAARAGMITL
jgi:hypothetical protein